MQSSGNAITDQGTTEGRNTRETPLLFQNEPTVCLVIRSLTTRSRLLKTNSSSGNFCSVSFQFAWLCNLSHSDNPHQRFRPIKSLQISLASISLHQGPEAAVVRVTGGGSFAGVPLQTIHHGSELLSSNLRHWEGTDNNGRMRATIGSSRNGKHTSAGPLGWGFSVEPQMAIPGQ